MTKPKPKRYTWDDVWISAKAVGFTPLNVPTGSGLTCNTRAVGLYKFLCHCGKEFSPPIKGICVGHYKSCGCRQFSSIGRPFARKYKWRDLYAALDDQKKKLTKAPGLFGGPGDELTGTEEVGQWEFICFCGNPFVCLPREVITRGAGCGCRGGRRLTKAALKTKIEEMGTLKLLGTIDRSLVKGDTETVQCKCGEIFTAKRSDILRGFTKSCGCLSVETSITRGLSIRKWTVGDTKEAAAINGLRYLSDLSDDCYINSSVIHVFICKCGHKFGAKPGDIRRGYVLSCGCTKSLPQREISDFIESLGFEVLYNDKTTIKKELDIVIPSHKLAIEFHGLYYHGETLSPKSKNKTLARVKLCQAAGYRLVVVFESEWLEKRPQIEDYLQSILIAPSIKIGARKCTIEQGKCPFFFKEFHLQENYGGIVYQLVYKGQTVAAASFSRPNGSKKGRNYGQYELNRYCVRSGFAISGALARLTDAFLKDHPNVPVIVTYSDNRWSEGGTYLRNGYTLEKEVLPTYWYFKKGTKGPLYHRFMFCKKGLIRLHGGDPNKTEWELAKEARLDRIWDTGKKRWILKSKYFIAPIEIEEAFC